MKVLITGAQGQVARGVRKGLAGRHSLRLMDIVPIQDPEGEAIRGSVANRRQVRRAVKGMDAIVHLAMRPHFNALAFDVSVKGTHILLEEALAEGVKKAVCTSTLSVYCGPSSHPFGAPETNGVTEDAPLVPDYWGYKMMKIFEEHVVRHFACEMGLPTVILRLTLPTAAEDWDAMAAAGTGSQQMTHLEDVAQAYRLALEKDGLGFDIFHIGPVDRDGRLPIDKAKRILGYEPKWSF